MKTTASRFLATLVVLWVSGCATMAPKAIEWEYKTTQGQLVTSTVDSTNRLDFKITQRVREGWEFVALTTSGDNYAVALFRRPKP